MPKGPFSVVAWWIAREIRDSVESEGQAWYRGVICPRPGYFDAV